MNFLHLINHEIKSSRWNDFYRVTAADGEQLLVAMRTEKSRRSDWACSCDEWCEMQGKGDCRHITQLDYEIYHREVRIPTLTPTGVNKTVFTYAEKQIEKITRALARYELNDIELLDLGE